ncbi:hypothetical protein PR003_g4530 [Phytophthora rubi]|uniref:Uncharacterized protein n=1 Tax=Phytophthora rubi TaxID=129364 RepID=A0A6A4G691_9STRA|nr:hypothetical protein PR003_g4530 [Phytophthora rubi]
MLSPQEINSAASFDPDLVHEVGEPGESTKRIIKMKLQLGLCGGLEGVCVDGG